MTEGSWVGLDVHARATVAGVLDAVPASCVCSAWRREARRRSSGSPQVAEGLLL